MELPTEYINYDNAPKRVKDSIYKVEPIVRKILEKRGDIVEKSTRDEDFNGIDLKVKNNEGKIIYIDVKSTEEKNDNTPNFSFTVKNINGRSYKDKDTDYYIFVNFINNELICISFEKLSPLVDKAEVRNGRGEYVLLNKDEVRKEGCSIIDEEIRRI